MARQSEASDAYKRRRPPATTLDSREKQMIGLADKLAEKQLIEGTATSQLIVHYLKLGTTREILEKEKLQAENELLRAKVEAIASAARIEDLYEKALNAMRKYSGSQESSDDF